MTEDFRLRPVVEERRFRGEAAKEQLTLLEMKEDVAADHVNIDSSIRGISRDTSSGPWMGQRGLTSSPAK